MNRVNLPALTGLVLLWLPLAGFAQDDDRPSHDFGDRKLGSKNISKFLNDRRNGERGGFDVGLMKKFMENFGDVIDPAMIDPDLVRKFMEDNPEFRDPKNWERLKELVDKQAREVPEQWDPKKIQEALQKVQDFQAKNKDLFDPKIDDPRVRQRKVDVEAVGKDRQEGPKDDRRANEMKRWLKKNFGNSAAMKNLTKDLSDRMNKSSKRKLDWMPKMKKDWLPSADWFKRKPKNKNKDGEVSSTSSSKLPDITAGFNLPSLPSVSRPSGETSSTTSSPSSGEGRAGAGFFGLVLLVVVGVAIWFYYFKVVKAPMLAEVPLPIPPVDLANLATRADVILAFEYLSVTQCGAEARNWHHNEIADKLGLLANADAAQQLARLYEKARYTPANEALTEGDLAAARQNVHLLTPGSTV